MSSHSIGPATPQESDVMLCKLLETKFPMCTLLESKYPMRNRDRVHTGIALIGVNKYCTYERDKPT